MEKVSFNVPSISCSACSKSIKEGMKNVEGVQNIDVDLKQQMVDIEYDSGMVTKKELASTINQMGFEVLE